MREVSFEERLSEIEGVTKFLKSEMDDMLVMAYNQAVLEEDKDLASNILRKIRNRKLQESDSSFTIDRLKFNINDKKSIIKSFEESAEWRTYRQKLRDITEQEGFPFNVVFPKTPDTNDNNKCGDISQEELLLKMILLAKMFVTNITNNQQALEVKEFFDEWQPNVFVKVGEYKRYKNNLYKVRQEHTTQSNWTPDKYNAGWEVIDKLHSGTKEDPIVYVPPMELFNGKYYTDGLKMYKCIRDSGLPMSHTLEELIAQYVELV